MLLLKRYKDEFVQRRVRRDEFDSGYQGTGSREVAITGVCRVAKAIVATPTEKRTKALDAAANSYRQTAQDLGPTMKNRNPGMAPRNYVSLAD